ncbi:MAG: ATP-dependent zinc protease [Alphaproteobacteria bacterium]|nr:ATP-dependent zinc protease [Alphaproteobacteria bacterium]
MKATKRGQPKIIGWREWVGLPELGIASLKAKIDTGARTTALHAVDLRPCERNGEKWIEFRVPLPGLTTTDRCRAPVVDEREIKNTSGVPERRYVIETVLVLGNRHWHIEVSLTDRENMEFETIIGRTAIRRHALLVDPGRSFLCGSPRSLTTEKSGPRDARKSNVVKFAQHRPASSETNKE